MGGGTWSASNYEKTAVRAKRETNAGFSSYTLPDEFNPLKIDMRESCKSTVNKNKDPISIVIGLDVTGSMGEIPKLLIRGHLGALMKKFLDAQTERENTQLMFAGIGDAPAGDRAPLQLTQFESDNRIEAQLQRLWLEGCGGTLGEESYNLLWYFAAEKTTLDCVKEGRKGVLITMGDEKTYPSLTPSDIKKVDTRYQGGTLSNQQLLDNVHQKYEVYHLIVADKKSSYDSVEGVDEFWHGLLGDRAIKVHTYEKISSVIMEIVDRHRPSKQAQAKQTEVTETSSFTYFRSSQQSGMEHQQEQTNLPNHFYCPITHEVMREPMVAADGHTYEKSAILEWFANGNNASPMTGLEMPHQDLLENHTLRSMIMESVTTSSSSSMTPAPV